MKNSPIVATILVTAFLSACAAPQVDRSTLSFDESRFSVDLNFCRGGNFAEASLKTIGIGALGFEQADADREHRERDEEQAEEIAQEQQHQQVDMEPHQLGEYVRAGERDGVEQQPEDAASVARQAKLCVPYM